MPQVLDVKPYWRIKATINGSPAEIDHFGNVVDSYGGYRMFGKMQRIVNELKQGVRVIEGLDLESLAVQGQLQHTPSR
jgi:hypothetical protein